MASIGTPHNPSDVWTVPEAFRTIYTHAVEVRTPARLLLISGQFGVAPDLVVSPEFADQLEQAMANIEALLRSASMDTTNMVKVTYYLTRTGDLPVLGQIRRQRWASSEPPAVTVLVVSALARPDCLVEVEVVAVAE